MSMMERIDIDQRIHARDLALRGYHVVYRRQEANFCPGCGRAHWWVGRFSAECGFCATVVPMADAHISPSESCNRHSKSVSREGAKTRRKAKPSTGWPERLFYLREARFG